MVNETSINSPFLYFFKYGLFFNLLCAFEFLSSSCSVRFAVLSWSRQCSNKFDIALNFRMNALSCSARTASSFNQSICLT